MVCSDETRPSDKEGGGAVSKRIFYKGGQGPQGPIPGSVTGVYWALRTDNLS